MVTAPELGFRTKPMCGTVSLRESTVVGNARGACLERARAARTRLNESSESQLRVVPPDDEAADKWVSGQRQIPPRPDALCQTYHVRDIL